MIVELKKGYTIESRYDKFTDSYITRLIDPDGKQVKDARYSDDMVDRNYDIQDIKDYFNNYINIGLSEKEAPDRNKPYEPEEDDDFAELEPEETFEDEEDMFEESLDQEVKKKARKTKIATRKSKLPALSKLSPIMPDQAKGIAKFNAMQPDGNSGMMSTTGSTSLGEEYMSRDLLIDKIRNMGYKYNFDKYTDAQLYRIYQERVETAKKRAAKRAERKQRATEEDNKRENAKDSYFKDGIEFESEDAAREYFGESMNTFEDNKYFGESMSKPYHWDVDEIERIILQAWEDADLRLRRDNIHISRHDNWCFVEIEHIDDWTFKHINKAWIKKTLKKELGLSEIKQSSWKNDGWGSRDYGKTLRYDMYVSDEQGMNESIDNKFYLNDMHKAWDIVEDFKENELKESLNESLTKSKDVHNFNTLNEGLSYFNTKAFEDNCQDVGLDLMFESVRDKLTKDDIKKLGALMNKTDDPDDVVTYVKGLLSEDLDNTVHITYKKSGYGGFTTSGEEVNIKNYASKFDEVVGDISGIYVAILLHSNIGHSYYDKIIFSNSLNECKRAANDWLYSPDKGSISYNDEHYYAMIVDLAKNEEIAHGDIWYDGDKISKGWREFPLKEDFDLDQFKDNLEREKDYYRSKAQGLKMLAYPLNNKIMRAAEKAHLWVDEEGCVIDDTKDEIQLSFYVDGDWKHDHAVFDMLVREIVYDMGMDLNGYYQEDESDSDSDDYRSLHVFEIDASKPNEINESLNESVQRSMIEGDIQIAVDHFRDECKYNNYHAEVTGIGNIDGYYIITGLIEDRVGDTKNPSEVLDILLHNLDMFDIPVDVSTDWQVTRLYSRMVFEISTKDQYNLKNENVTTAEDIDEVQRILKVLNSEGFILDDAVQVPLQMNPFGGSRKMVHFQVINPDLYYPTSETEGEEITEDEAHRLFVDDIKPLVAALDDLESEDDFEGYITFNFGANKDGKITAGLDWRE